MQIYQLIVIFKILKSMELYREIMVSVWTNVTNQGITKLLNCLNDHHDQIVKHQIAIPSKSHLFQFLKKHLSPQSSTNQSNFISAYHKILSFLYHRHSLLIKITYEFIPHLLIRFLQMDVKIEGLDECIIVIHNNQLNEYNKEGEKRRDMTSSISSQQLYHHHMNKSLVSKEWHFFKEIETITTHNRHLSKAVLLWVWYSKVTELTDMSVEQYFNLIYLYCGGNEKEAEKGVSLYLLEKKNQLNLFKYSLSEEEIQWIILCLYDLAVQRQNFKYQLLSAISMIHKKAANECQFRLSEIAQSVIHLLEDQYAELF